jgi:F0F1-type ATP synthase assembly protein I
MRMRPRKPRHLCSIRGSITHEKTMPTPNPDTRKAPGGLNTLVKAEKLVQIALVLPISLLIGWGGGVLLDKWLHQHWIYIVGILFGAAAGLIEAVREALRASN